MLGTVWFPMRGEIPGVILGILLKKLLKKQLLNSMYTVKESKGNNQPSGVPLILCQKSTYPAR